MQTFLDSAREGNIDELNTLLMQHAELINALDDRESRENPFIRKGATALIYVSSGISIALFSFSDHSPLFPVFAIFLNY